MRDQKFNNTVPHLTRRSTLLGLGAGVGAAMGAGFAGSMAQAAETPKRGGHFRIAVDAGSTGDTLDPGTLVDTHTYLISHAICDHLVEIDADKAPIPELAESWSASNRARTWTFNLRKGVEFHNGIPAIHPYYIITPPLEHMKPAAQAFEAWIVEHFKGTVALT